ncbi:MAG: TVP38/TMEM64 family protein [Nanoarchaeota archaeon]
MATFISQQPSRLESYINRLINEPIVIRPKFNFSNRLVLSLFLIFIFGVAALAFIYQDQLKLIYKNPETVKQYAAGFGAFAPVIFILSYVVQAFVLFIPSSLLTMSGGYIFGIVFGTVYSLIGVTIGSIIVFLIARKLGRPFFRKIISKKELEHFDVFFKKRGDRSILLARSIPMLFPLDVVSIAAGLTQIKLRHYVFFSILGFIPNLFILALFGERLSKGINPATIIVLFLISLAVLSYIFRHPLKVFLIKEIKEYERKIIDMEEKLKNTKKA